MLRNNITRTMAMTLALSSLIPVSAFAADFYSGDGTYLGNETYHYSMTPTNSDIATKSGNSKIKITQGNAESLTLTPKTLENCSYVTKDVEQIAKNSNWL